MTIAELEAQLRRYEAKFEMSSADLPQAITSGKLSEDDPAVFDWGLLLEAYNAVNAPVREPRRVSLVPRRRAAAPRPGVELVDLR